MISLVHSTVANGMVVMKETHDLIPAQKLVGKKEPHVGEGGDILYYFFESLRLTDRAVRLPKPNTHRQHMP